jgi:hypothetical protein
MPGFDWRIALLIFALTAVFAVYTRITHKQWMFYPWAVGGITMVVSLITHDPSWLLITGSVAIFVSLLTLVTRERHRT